MSTHNATGGAMTKGFLLLATAVMAVALSIGPPNIGESQPGTGPIVDYEVLGPSAQLGPCYVAETDECITSLVVVAGGAKGFGSKLTKVKHSGGTESTVKKNYMLPKRGVFHCTEPFIGPDNCFVWTSEAVPPVPPSGAWELKPGTVKIRSGGSQKQITPQNWFVTDSTLVKVLADGKCLVDRPPYNAGTNLQNRTVVPDVTLAALQNDQCGLGLERFKLLAPEQGQPKSDVIRGWEYLPTNADITEGLNSETFAWEDSGQVLVEEPTLDDNPSNDSVAGLTLKVTLCRDSDLDGVPDDCPAVGGIAELPDVAADDAPLQRADSTTTSAGILAVAIAGAVLVASVTLGGVAWYTRRRSMR